LFLNCDELRLRYLNMSIGTGEDVIGYSMQNQKIIAA